MKRKIKILIVGVFSALFLFAICGCDDAFKTYSTWTIENSAYGVSYIEVTPKNDANCGTFTLYPGQSKEVTWEGHGEDYYSMSWTTYGGKSYMTKYDALRKLVFYTQR